MVQQTCMRCGMQQSEWKGNNGQGVSSNGQPFCCPSCAENTGCTCR